MVNVCSSPGGLLKLRSLSITHVPVKSGFAAANAINERKSTINEEATLSFILKLQDRPRIGRMTRIATDLICGNRQIRLIRGLLLYVSIARCNKGSSRRE